MIAQTPIFSKLPRLAALTEMGFREDFEPRSGVRTYHRPAGWYVKGVKVLPPYDPSTGQGFYIWTGSPPERTGEIVVRELAHMRGYLVDYSEDNDVIPYAKFSLNGRPGDQGAKQISRLLRDLEKQ